MQNKPKVQFCACHIAPFLSNNTSRCCKQKVKPGFLLISRKVILYIASIEQCGGHRKNQKVCFHPGNASVGTRASQGRWLQGPVPGEQGREVSFLKLSHFPGSLTTTLGLSFRICKLRLIKVRPVAFVCW